MTTMSTERDNETRTENKPTTRASTPSSAPESFDKDATPRPESSEFRETVERGYGWGV